MTASASQAPRNCPDGILMLLYALSLAFNATVGSLVVIVAAEPLFLSGEAWSGAGIVWAVSIPAIIALSACSCLVYPAYRRATTTLATCLIYLGNLACVVVGGIALTYWLTF